MLRKAVVKGYFYPDNREELVNFFEQNKEKQKSDAILAIVPHAGYIFSGKTAVKTISSINLKKKVLMLGPNHTGFGEKVALFPDGEWETPFGILKVDNVLNSKLKLVEDIKEDIVAHVREHSLEVILPILHYFSGDITFSAITMMPMRYNQCIELAEKIYQNVRDEEFTIVVSSDFNHYEDAETTNKKDMMAIENILALDSKGLYDVVFSKDISMCGVYPAIVGIELAKLFGAKEAKLIEHTHSGYVNGDYSQVVGYAGILIQ